MEKLRDSFAEVLRFTAFIVVFVLFDHWIPDADGLGWEVAEAAGIAFVSGALVLLFVELLLGQPTIRLEWLIAGSPAESDSPEVRCSSPLGAVVRVNLLFEGTTGLAHLVRAFPRFFSLRVVITFSPQQLVFLTAQTLPNGVAVVGNDTMVFDLGAGPIPVGRARFAEFTVRTITSAVANEEVQCGVRVRSSRLLVPGRLIARRQPGIKSLSIQRR